MEIQAIDNRSFAVYIAGEELALRHLDPGELTVGQARELVGSVLRSDLPGAVRLELYPGRHEMLIFVKRSLGEPEFYRFADLESLLAAVGECRGAVASSLFFYDGAYILAVWSDGRDSARLREFCDARELPAGYLSHLAEHARVLLDGDAVESLKKLFL